jgi:hypothetical protein
LTGVNSDTISWRYQWEEERLPIGAIPLIAAAVESGLTRRGNEHGAAMIDGAAPAVPGSVRL